MLLNRVCDRYKVFLDHHDESYGLMVSGLNLVSSANQIAFYANKEDAESHFELFCSNLKIALETGYFISKNLVSHHDGRTLYLTNFLDGSKTGEQIKNDIRTGLMLQEDV